MKPLAAAGLLLALAAPAHAADYYADARRYAYDRGYEDGLHEGEKDGKHGDRFQFSDEGRYRDGDHGYNRRYGPRHQYTSLYRRGFEEGYRRAYERFTPYRSYGRGRYDDRYYGDRYDRDRYYYDDRYRR